MTTDDRRILVAPSLDDPRIPAIVEEFRELILTGYPEATFEVGRGDDPTGVYLKAIVDIDDPMDVLDLIMDRMLHVQVEDYLPVYVIPMHPLVRSNHQRDADPTVAAASVVHGTTAAR